MSELQRYYINATPSRVDDNGLWVDADEALALVEKLRAENAKLEKIAKVLVNTCAADRCPPGLSAKCDGLLSHERCPKCWRAWAEAEVEKKGNINES